MKLLIRQKVFSWGDQFSVQDEQGNDKYFVKGEIFSWGKKLHVYDLYENEVAFIQQKVFSFLPRFFVFVNDSQVAEIVKEFTFFYPKYSITGLGWNIDGDFWSHNYTIDQNGMDIVGIRKEWFSWGDFYTLDIANPEDEILALAVVLTIDCVIDAQSSNSASAGV